MKKNFLSKHLFLRKNIRNWTEYTFRKNERAFRTLIFTTRPNALQFEVNRHNYPIFKELFVEDFYGLSTFLSRLSEDPIIVDIGANAGFFPILLLSKKPKARFFCYEPLPANIAYLNRLKQMNPSINKQLKVFQLAVTDKNKGNITLFTEDNPNESAIASIHQNFDKRNKSSITVPVTDLSAIIQDNGLEEIDILKLDCEGAEFQILYSTPPPVMGRVKLILLEVHNLDNDKHNIKAMSTFLQLSGFTIQFTPFHNNCYYVFAERK